MVTIGMNYRVLPDKSEVFERACSSVVEAMRSVDGHQETHLFRDVADPQSYLIVSEWASEEAFQAFIGSEGFRRVTDWGREQILVTRPTHTVYRR